MQDSMAHPRLDAGVDLPGWKTGFALTCAALLALLFIVSGGWKLTDPFGWSVRLVQMRFPGFLSMPGTLAVGIAEVFAGLLILVPRFRRWGAMLISALLVVFMIYIGIFYNELRGAECSCFPWLKRAFVSAGMSGDTCRPASVPRMTGQACSLICSTDGWFPVVAQPETSAMMHAAMIAMRNMKTGEYTR